MKRIKRINTLPAKRQEESSSDFLNLTATDVLFIGTFTGVKIKFQKLHTYCYILWRWQKERKREILFQKYPQAVEWNETYGKIKFLHIETNNWRKKQNHLHIWFLICLIQKYFLKLQIHLIKKKEENIKMDKNDMNSFEIEVKVWTQRSFNKKTRFTIKMNK